MTQIIFNNSKWKLAPIRPYIDEKLLPARRHTFLKEVAEMRRNYKEQAYVTLRDKAGLTGDPEVFYLDNNQEDYYKNKTFIGPYMYVPADSGSIYYILRPIIESFTSRSLDYAHIKYSDEHPEVFKTLKEETFVLQCEKIIKTDEGTVLLLSDYFDSIMTTPFSGNTEDINTFQDKLLAVDLEFVKAATPTGEKETRALLKKIVVTPFNYKDYSTYPADALTDGWMKTFLIKNDRMEPMAISPFADLIPQELKVDTQVISEKQTTDQEMLAKAGEYIDCINRLITYDGIHTPEMYGAHPNYRSTLKNYKMFLKNSFGIALNTKAESMHSDNIRFSLIYILERDMYEAKCYFVCPYMSNQRIFCFDSAANYTPGFYLVTTDTCANIDAIKVRKKEWKKINEYPIARGMLGLDKADNNVYEIVSNDRIFGAFIPVDPKVKYELEATNNLIETLEAIPSYNINEHAFIKSFTDLWLIKTIEDAGKARQYARPGKYRANEQERKEFILNSTISVLLDPKISNHITRANDTIRDKRILDGTIVPATQFEKRLISRKNNICTDSSNRLWIDWGKESNSEKDKIGFGKQNKQYEELRAELIRQVRENPDFVKCLKRFEELCYDKEEGLRYLVIGNTIHIAPCQNYLPEVIKACMEWPQVFFLWGTERQYKEVY